MSAPVRTRVRMYQVGFGDCFLVSIEYDGPLEDGRAARHILIDYGTSHSPREGMARGRMADVAALVEEHTGGHLDVLVVTHRHRDHLRGFEVDISRYLGHPDVFALFNRRQHVKLLTSTDGPEAILSTLGLTP